MAHTRATLYHTQLFFMSDPTTQDHHPDNPELPLGADAATDKPAKKKAPKKKRAQVATKKKITEEACNDSEGNGAGSISSDDASAATESSAETHQVPPRIGRVKGLGPVKRTKMPAEETTENSASEQDESEVPIGNDQGEDNQPRKNIRNNRRNGRNNRNNKRERPPKREIVLTGEPVDVNGMLELAPKGFGFLRVPEKNYTQCKKDVFVPPDFIRRHGLRPGVWVQGTSQDGPRGPQLTEIKTINGIDPGEAFKLPHFEELKAINPDRRIAFETTPERFTTRVLDIISPVGRGQRGDRKSVV